jgi:hypothetical protein
MAIQNLDDFKRYCLRTLGAPIVSVDVTDDQLQDRYEDAKRKFQDHHYDGSERTYVKHQITASDRTNKYITVPADILGVLKVLPYTTGAAGAQDANLFSVQYQFLLNEMHTLWTAGNIAYYEHTMQHLTMLDQLLNGKPTFRFNKVQNKVYIDTNWDKRLLEGNWVVFECLKAVDPEVDTEVFSDPWFRKYTTALIKRQWGENLKKFAGVQMVGGVALNGQIMWDEATREIDALENELRNTWEEPVDAIYVG